MAVRIGSNIASLNAQRRLSDATTALGSVFERLSSGMRINRASDDAAGLAISSSLNANGRIASVAIRNISDGQSMLSIADGALEQQGGILMRMRELAEQSANGTYSTGQRKALNTEFETIRDEFYRISSTAIFNGRRLIDGNSSSTFGLQVGLTGSEAQIALQLQGQGRLQGRVDMTKPGVSGGSRAIEAWIAANFDKVLFTDQDLFESGFDGQIVRTTGTDDQGRQRETAVFLYRSYNAADGAPIIAKAFVRSLDDPTKWEGEMSIFDYGLFSSGPGDTQINANGTVGTNNIIDLYAGGDNAVTVTVDFEQLRFYDGVNGAAYANSTAALETLDIRDAARSRYALDSLSSRLSDTASTRGNLGAYMQRLSIAQQNLYVSRENFAAAESRIKDADIAQESSELIRLKILQQTATAILSQANTLPRLALDLLRG